MKTRDQVESSAGAQIDAPPAQLIYRTYTDFDQLTAETQAWNMDFSKLDAAPFHGEIFQLISSEMLITRGKFNGRLKQLGTPPLGFRTFTIPVRPDFWMYWRGRQVYGNNIMAFPFGSELDTISDPQFDIFTISVLEETLFNLAASLGFSELEAILKTEEVFDCPPIPLNRLRCSLFQSSIEAKRAVPHAEHMKNRVLVRLLQALGAAHSISSCHPEPNRRLLAIQKTDRLIQTQPDDIPPIKELCKLTHVSERTLEYAFLETYGMKPKAYINAMRLNGARRALFEHQRIADAANLWGFWHMGQFAADYRKLFGENPSQTLAQNR